MSFPHLTSAVMYLGLPVLSMTVGLIAAHVIIPVGLVGSQLPPPPITGMTHHFVGMPLLLKKVSAFPNTVLTCPLFWQIRVPMSIVPSIDPPEQVLAV